jgi:hypothetical protein
MSAYPEVTNHKRFTSTLEILLGTKPLRQHRVKLDSANYSQSGIVPHHSRRSYQLGSRVEHGGYGAGRIVSHFPDGRLLVRFDKENKNRLVFPSFLIQIIQP